MPDHYEKQLQYIFDRPVTKPEWYWSDEEDPRQLFDPDPLSGFSFVEKFLLNPGEDLRNFSDDQVALGLNYIFNHLLSDLALNFKNAEVPAERRVEALKALINLFREVYEPRCIPKLSAGTQASISLLNNRCYMFWEDENPLANWLEKEKDQRAGEEPGIELTPENLSQLAALDPNDADYLEKASAILPMPPLEVGEEVLEAELRKERSRYAFMSEERRRYYRTIAEVMDQCLYLDNPACVESALHGLGHMAFNQPDLAGPIIDRYLADTKNPHPQLEIYARRARTGRIL